MAFVLKPTVQVTFNFKDKDNNLGHTEMFFDSSQSIAVLTSDVGGVSAPLIQAVSDGQLMGYNLSYSYVQDTLVAPGAFSDVERKGKFSFKALSGARHTIEVPSFIQAKVNTGSNSINLTDADVMALRDMIVSGTLLSVMRNRTYLGSDISEFMWAKKTHRKSEKG